jgi:hypothetical protein
MARDRSLEGLGAAYQLERILGSLETKIQHMEQAILFNATQSDNILTKALAHATRSGVDVKQISQPGGWVEQHAEQVVHEAMRAQSQTLAIVHAIERAAIGRVENPAARENAAAIAQLGVLRDERAARQDRVSSEARQTVIGSPADTSRRVEEAKATLQTTREKTAEMVEQHAFETGAVGKPLMDQQRLENARQAAQTARDKTAEMQEQRSFRLGAGASVTGQERLEQIKQSALSVRDKAEDMAATRVLEEGTAKPVAAQRYLHQQQVVAEERKADLAEAQRKLDFISDPARGGAARREQFVDETRAIGVQRETLTQERAIREKTPEGQRLSEREALEAADKRLDAARMDRDNLQQQLNLLNTSTAARVAAIDEIEARIDAMRTKEAIDEKVRPFTDREKTERHRIDRANREREAPAEEAQQKIDDIRRQMQTVRYGMSAEGKAKAQELQGEQVEAKKLQTLLAPTRREQLATAQAALAARQTPEARTEQRAEILHAARERVIDTREQVETMSNRLETMRSPQGQQTRSEETEAVRELTKVQKQLAYESRIDQYGKAGAKLMSASESLDRTVGRMGAGGAGISQFVTGTARIAGGIGAKDPGMIVEGAIQSLMAIKQFVDRTTAAASPQEAGRAEGAWEILMAKIGTKLLPLRRTLTEETLAAAGEDKKLMSMRGLAPPVSGTAETVYAQMQTRALSVGAHTVESAQIRIQMENLRGMGLLLEKIEENTRAMVPNFRG